jgi:hypothetical protein
MSLPTLRVLLAELDKINHAGRSRRVALLARDHGTDPKFGKLLDGLTGTSNYHTKLALLAATVSGDTDRLIALTTHPSQAIRASALLAMPVADNGPADFTQRYLNTPLATRPVLVHKATQAHRPDLITALLAAPLADVDKAALLAYADPDAAAEYLGDLGDLIPNLSAFGQHHPPVLLDELARRLDSAPLVREQAWEWITPALARLAVAEPHRLLQLLGQYLPGTGLPDGPPRYLSALAKADPSAVAGLLARSSHTPGAATRRDHDGRLQFTKGLRHSLRALSGEDRSMLAQHFHRDEPMLAAFLNIFAPSERAALFTEAFAEVNTTNRAWSDELLDVLPHQTRQEEAQRIAALPENQAVTMQVTWAGFLDPAVAEPILIQQLRAGEAEERTAAWRSLLAAAGRSRDPEVLSATFAHLERLKNEQDPVRYGAAVALARIPASLLGSTSIEPLQAFAHAVAEARDTSSATLLMLQRLAWTLIEQAGQSGTDLAAPLGMLETLYGRADTTRVPATLAVPNASVPTLIAALLPRMRAQAKRHEYWLAFALWRSLGRRAWDVPELSELIEAALSAPSDYWQRSAAEAWLEPPATRGQRVEALLKRDETFATVPAVQQVLCQHRQDLVDVCFRATPLKGRFWKRVLFVPVLAGPFVGWLPRQTEAYADALVALIASPKAPDHLRSQTITTIARLPETGGKRLATYLASDRPIEQEAALAALAQTDDLGLMLEPLLAHRRDDRAQVALCAAGRCVRHRQPVEAARLLDEVLADPEAKVTSRKQAVRLIGRLRVPGSLDVLTTLGSGPGVHLDVRIAATRTLRHFLDDDHAWAALEDLAVDGRDAALSLIKTQPNHIAVRHRARFAQVLALAASGGDPEVIEALGAWARWSPHIADQLAVLATSQDMVTAAAATRAVRILAASATDWTAFLTTIEALAQTAASAEEPNAGASADQPSRQRVERLVSALRPRQLAAVSFHRERLAELAATLEAHPHLIRSAWKVSLTAIDWTAPTAELTRLAAGVDPLRAGELRALVRRKLVIAASQGVEPQLAEAVAALVAHADAPSGGLALALVEHAGEQTGWSKQWRRHLRALREHPSPTVAAWAWETYTVEG